MPYCIFLLPLPKIRYPQVHGFISRLSILFPAKTMATHSSTLAWEIPWTESLVGYSPWGREESDTTERLHFYFSLSCTGEGNGNPLQYSCLENPMDRGAWWAAIYGAIQSRTRLKRLSSSSSRLPHVLQPYLPTLGPVHLCSLHLRCSLQAFCVAGSFSVFACMLSCSVVSDSLRPYGL